MSEMKAEVRSLARAVFAMLYVILSPNPLGAFKHTEDRFGWADS